MSGNGVMGGTLQNSGTLGSGGGGVTGHNSLPHPHPNFDMSRNQKQREILADLHQKNRWVSSGQGQFISLLIRYYFLKDWWVLKSFSLRLKYLQKVSLNWIQWFGPKTPLRNVCKRIVQTLQKNFLFYHFIHLQGFQKVKWNVVLKWITLILCFLLSD